MCNIYMYIIYIYGYTCIYTYSICMYIYPSVLRFSGAEWTISVCIGCNLFCGGALFHSRPDPSFRNNKSCQGTGIPGSHGMEGKSPEALPQTWSSSKWWRQPLPSGKLDYTAVLWALTSQILRSKHNTSQTQCKAIIVLVGDVMPPEISTQQLAPFQLTYEAFSCFTYRTWKRYRDTTVQLWNSWNSLNHGILVQLHGDDSSYPGE